MNEEEISKKYLPIGTVCLLKGARQYVMITGYLPVSLGKNREIFDYSACDYPYGVASSTNNMVFNRENIEEIVFTGYKNETYTDFIKKLPEVEAKAGRGGTNGNE